MSANSTVLASLVLQVQDNENTGQLIVNRQVPQFSFQAVQSPYAGYVTVIPGASAIVLVPSGTFAHFFFVRNATNPTGNLSGYLLTVGWQDSTLVETNSTTITPGGWVMQANQSAGNNNAGAFSQLNISAPGSGQPIVAEYMFAI